MRYPDKLENYEKIINRYAKYKTEMGSAGVEDVLENIRASLDEHIARLTSLPEDPHRANEPSTLDAIQAASDWGPVSFPGHLDEKTYQNKLQGALIGRFAGCALGAPVELVSMEEMELFAQTLAIPFPPENYWPEAPVGFTTRYKVGRGRDFALPNMKALPPDDDIIYTILALLILEEYGPELHDRKRSGDLAASPAGGLCLHRRTLDARQSQSGHSPAEGCNRSQPRHRAHRRLYPCRRLGLRQPPQSRPCG